MIYSPLASLHKWCEELRKDRQSNGLNDSEQYLGKLAKISFLTLWSHQNVYRDVGKELADLLVVCGNIIIIFSDKSIKFNVDVEINVGWKRWYKKAVTESVWQLSRASRWIRNQPDRIFFDASCKHRMKLEQTGNSLEIFRIAVANGAAVACVSHFSGGSGSLMISPNVDPADPPPFVVGNPGGDNEFVHVFDEANLHILLQELDTISDFVGYLRARERVIRNKNLVISAGEEDLLAQFMIDINEYGEHDFVIESGKSLTDQQLFGVEEGSYKAVRDRPEYLRKKSR